jgi:hypothetical protein
MVNLYSCYFPGSLSRMAHSSSLVFVEVSLILEVGQLEYSLGTLSLAAEHKSPPNSCLSDNGMPN